MNAHASRMTAERRVRLRISGVVQGVGFRPFAHALAGRLALDGFIRNDADGVLIEIEGERTDAFVDALRAAPPPLARIDEIEATNVAPRGERGFTIEASTCGQGRARIGPDAGMCEDCLDDLFDPASRFHLYPFVTCTNCGPRFTLARALPYDRARTSMAGFALCPNCARDYTDPSSRRFHAEPIACPKCGPRLSLPVPDVAARLRAGAIVALKGLGGYHLACDAFNAEAVERLRRAKQRDGKPFAVMVSNLASARRLAEIDEVEAALLSSAARPIVVVRSHGRLPESVAPGLNAIGLMLAYTPLHWLIFHALLGAPAAFDREAQNDIALVMTSANLSGEPLITADADARSRLEGIAEVVVSHDRRIVTRADDSVLRVIDGAPRFMRRARGFVPDPIDLGEEGPCVFAAGGDLKNTIVITRGREAFLSQHIGDLDDRETLRFRHETIDHLGKLLGVTPEVVACDLHPDFVSRRHAEGMGLPVIEVQHHVAHVAAVVAEHCLDGPVLGVALDGQGFGTDGTAWGGELILLDGASWSRRGRLRPLALPGGDRAAREPWRMALSILLELGSEGAVDRVFADIPEAGALARALRTRLKVPVTSSLGRLFDAAAFFAGLRARQGFEGQAAMELEALATAPVALPGGWRVKDGGLDMLPLFAALVSEGGDAARVANLFHGTLAEGLAAWITATAHESGVARIALGGGCLMNRVLTEVLLSRLREVGLQPFIPRAAPCNDGGLALGQAAFARARLRDAGTSRED